MSRLTFYLKALGTHLLLALPLVFHEALRTLKDQGGMLGNVLYFGGAACFLAALLVFYFKLDYLFLSFRLHQERTLDASTSPVMAKAAFRARKIAVAALVTLGSVSYLTLAGELPPLLRMYVFLYGVGMVLLSVGYLLHSHEEYATLKRSGRWGIASVRSGRRH